MTRKGRPFAFSVFVQGHPRGIEVDYRDKQDMHSQSMIVYMLQKTRSIH